jgi:hypothetical protein
MNAQWYGLLGIALSVIGSIVVARLSSRAQDRTARQNADASAGELALKIAERADLKAERNVQRIDTLEGHVRSVNRWWVRHERRDKIAEEHLTRLDPTLMQALPPWESMPELDTPPQGLPKVDG